MTQNADYASHERGYTDGAKDFVVTTVENKTYIKIPGGEVQYGRISGSVVVWLDGKCHVVRPAHGSGAQP